MIYPELKVKIRKKHEDNLRDRFDYELAELVMCDNDSKVISVRCPLCDIYFKRDLHRGSCKGCPFNKFSPQGATDGCLEWSRDLIRRWNEDHLIFTIYVGWEIDSSEIRWRAIDDKSVRYCLPRFAELALEHVIFY